MRIHLALVNRPRNDVRQPPFNLEEVKKKKMDFLGLNITTKNRLVSIFFFNTKIILAGFLSLCYIV